ncbi:MAG: hypothetical protein VKL42_16675 [Snowella sp.]|nr:hypothetical protein [Snowella sp.]
MTAQTLPSKVLNNNLTTDPKPSALDNIDFDQESPQPVPIDCKDSNKSDLEKLDDESDGSFKNLMDNLFIFMIGGAFIGSLIAQTPGLIVGLIVSGILAINIQKPNTSQDHK